MMSDWYTDLGSIFAYLPWLALFLVTLPLGLVAYYRNIYPQRFVCALLLVPLLLSLSVSMLEKIIPVVLALDFGLILLLLIDSFLILDKKSFVAHREMQKAASIEAPHDVELAVDYLGNRTIQLMIRDDSPDGIVLDPPEHKVTVPPKKRIQIKYRLSASRRGVYEFQHVYVKVSSRFGFWQRVIKLACHSTLNVYPDMKQLAEYAILARSNRLSLIGVRRTRKIGQDSDFERLRDYTFDDNYKFIDWRSTARRSKLTVKDFQSDQSQRVVFMLDCGRMMTNVYNGLSLVDYGLNSLLMLSHVALSQGDAVGLVCFSDRVDRYVPPRSGRSQLNQLLHAGFDRFPQLVESRFDEAFLHLSSHLRKRSLVVLITSIIDQVNADQITNYLGSLQKRHLPLLVLLRDHRLFDAADNPIDDPEVLYRSAAAASILTWREQVLTRLRMQGVLTVDAFPEQMTSPMINEYLKAKAKHLL